MVKGLRFRTEFLQYGVAGEDVDERELRYCVRSEDERFRIRAVRGKDCGVKGFLPRRRLILRGTLKR
jgi:hypothetical protein